MGTLTTNAKSRRRLSHVRLPSALFSNELQCPLLHTKVNLVKRHVASRRLNLNYEGVSVTRISKKKNMKTLAGEQARVAV
jgi:hypothetical protein